MPKPDALVAYTKITQYNVWEKAVMETPDPDEIIPLLLCDKVAD